MAKHKVVAYESANGFVKVFGEGSKKTFVYANTMTEAAKEEFGKLTGERSTKTVYEFDGERFNAGQTVDYGSSSSDSISRYGTVEYLRESLIAISHVAKDGDVLTVCTGIPSTHYDNKEEATKLITENLKGDSNGLHTFKIDGEEISFTIKNVLVTMQGLASFFYCVMDETGDTDEDMIERFEETETLVLDIGWKSSDVALLRGSGLTRQFDLRDSMQTAYELIAEGIKEKYPNDPIASANLQGQLLDLEKQLRKGDTYKYGNKQYSVSDIKINVFKKIADRIIKEVDGIRTLSKFTTVILTGGGTIALLPELQELLSDKNGELKENIFIIDRVNAQISNVKGYYIFAKYLQD